MAFEDFQIRTTPATSDDVLAVLLEHHRQYGGPDLPEHTPFLSRESTIAQYERTCWADEYPLTHRHINRIFRTNYSERQMLKLLQPKRKRTLGELCDAIAPGASIPRIDPVTVCGATSESAGAFLVIRKLFADAGANAREITPSSPIEPYLREHPDVYARLGYLAPGRVPTPTFVSPTYIGLTWMWLIGKAMLILGWITHNTNLRLMGLLNIGVVFVAAISVGRRIKPARIQLGWLQTFRDLSRAMTGEAWGAWHGFPMDQG
jgi:hypothetical protein